LSIVLTVFTETYSVRGAPTNLVIDCSVLNNGSTT
jgi:hypothetical protein